MELSSPKIKKVLIFQEVTFRARKKKNRSEKFFIFQEMELSCDKLSKLLIFQEGTCKA